MYWQRPSVSRAQLTGIRQVNGSEQDGVSNVYIIFSAREKNRSACPIVYPEQQRASHKTEELPLLIDEYKNKEIEDLSFEGEGCAISLASASILTEIVKGKDLSFLPDRFQCLGLLFASEQKGVPCWK